MSDIKYFTQEGYDKLTEELDFLKQVERPRITQEIADARDKGDLSENAEYDAAKEAQGLLEARISKLENDLSNARVLDETQTDTSTVHLLTKVTILNIDNNLKMTYSIVSETEADLAAKKISVTSPIGKGLLGKSVGEIAEIQVPNGVACFKILDISSL